MSWLKLHFEQIVKALQVVALFWLAFEVHQLVDAVYRGEDLKVEVTAPSIEDKLDDLTSAIETK